MSEHEPVIDETGRNPTQRRMDEEGADADARPTDAEWGTGEAEDEEDGPTPAA